MSIVYIIISLIALSILVLVHEFGHFWAAKKRGVWVEEFGIGLPPRVWGKKRGETIYSVNALPLGGFVRLHGETLGEKVSKANRAFVNKSKLSRAIIALAGVAMNFLFATIVFSLLYFDTGVPLGVKITEVQQESPASAGGIKPEDIIISVNDQKVDDLWEMQEISFDNRGKEVELRIEREEEGIPQEIVLPIVIRSEAPEGEGLLGIVMTPREIYKPAVWQRPFVYSYYGAKRTVVASQKIFSGFGEIFGQLFLGKIPPGVAGPLGVTAFVAEASKFGILPLMEFMAIISINLALINLVPFPPLDGSRVLFLGVEAITGKKALPKIESIVHTVGMVLILLLMVSLTLNEIPKLLAAGSLSAFVESLIPQQ